MMYIQSLNLYKLNKALYKVNIKNYTNILQCKRCNQILLFNNFHMRHDIQNNNFQLNNNDHYRYCIYKMHYITYTMKNKIHIYHEEQDDYHNLQFYIYHHNKLCINMQTHIFYNYLSNQCRFLMIQIVHRYNSELLKDILNQILQEAISRMNIIYFIDPKDIIDSLNMKNNQMDSQIRN
ncbi:unnamed protein product [Paramecium primaurelia]|uniref:Uncharacterized protein n=1 Tax=Paramecium primaurelia TaxID=5886 RepID=A0A8S1Q6B9_PARPR|nr:unnamed protein product [Paramecium primaurelia]